MHVVVKMMDAAECDPGIYIPCVLIREVFVLWKIFNVIKTSDHYMVH